ncbi:MAG: heavy metal translocating P-type ATPase, partial [Anaeroplasma sp.]
MTKKNKILIGRLIISIIIWAIAIVLENILDTNLEIIYALLYVIAYIIAGYDILIGAIRNILNGNLLDEFFLMSIASIGAFAMRFLGDAEYLEAVAVMIFFQIGEVFQGIAVEKSRNAIMNTMQLKATKCMYSNGEAVEPEKVKIGEEILVKPGEMVPLDGIATSCGSVNTASLTGEPLDSDISIGDVVLSGSINTTTPLIIKVTKEFSDSTANKILDMVENATMKKAKSEKFISKFAHVYTPIVVILALVLAVVPPTIMGLINGFSFELYKNFVYAALTCLVVSCPCALVVSVPLTYFAGIGANAKRKIIIKGGSYLEDLALTDTIILDKTGTLTKASFEITNVIGDDEILKIAKGLEINSTHPLAMAIKKIDCDYYDFEISEAPGYGIIGKLNNDEYVCGSKKLLNRMNIEAIEIEEAGSVLYIAKNSKCIGAIILQDIVKDEAYESIALLRKMGKRIIVLSGDTKSSVEVICNKLGINEYYYGLLPQDKVMKAEEIINSNSTNKVLFVGDGINDAPVLALANVGVSMGQIG